MTRPTQPRRKINRLFALLMPVGLAACGAQDAQDAFSDIALPTFSKDRVAREAPVEVRRVLSGDGELDFESLDVSPDGRHVTDIDWNTGDLAIRDLVTGETRPVTNNLSWRNGQYPDGSAFSPDGERIAYVWQAAADETNPTWRWELRSIGVDGSDMKVHLSFDDNGVYEEPLDWSMDGRYILTFLAGDAWDSSQLATVDVTTNEVRVLKTMEDAWRWPEGAFFSPDGRFVAFDLRADPSSMEHDLYIVAADGSDEATLLQTPDQEALLGWLPDGSGILFHRISEDSRAIWKLPVQNGRAVGPPELIKDDVWQMDGFGFSAEDFFYGVTVRDRQVHTASFDLETGQVLEGLEPVVELSHPGTGAPEWSPDGRRLAYIETDAGATRLIIRSLTGEILQDLPLAVNPRGGTVAWTPHGVLMLASGTGLDTREGYYLVSPETGEASFVTVGGRRGSSVSEDGSKLFVTYQGERTITVHDLVTGAESAMADVEPLSGPGAGFHVVSPDGNYIAQKMRQGPPNDEDLYINIVSRSSGEVRRTDVDLTGFGAGFNVVWSPDSGYVLFQGYEGSGDDYRGYIYRFSMEDGSVIRLIELTRDLFRAFGLSVSSDGRHVAMTTGDTRLEIWRMSFGGGG